MRSSPRRRKPIQLRLFGSQTPPVTWESLPEKSKRRLRRLLSRMIREAAERGGGNTGHAGASNE